MTTTTVTVRTMSDLAASVPAVLGFTPSDSLVVVGLGGGPTARVDLHETSEMVASFAPVAVHWQRVAVVVFSDDAERLADIVAAMWRAMPTVEVVASTTVDSDGILTDAVGAVLGKMADRAPGVLAARQVESSREALIAEAQSIATRSEAWTMASTAYAAGAGARAWCYLDRYVALLGGTPNARARRLEARLAGAVSPNAAR